MIALLLGALAFFAALYATDTVILAVAAGVFVTAAAFGVLGYLEAERIRRVKNETAAAIDRELRKDG